MVGIIDKLRKLTTSLVLSFAPRIPRLRSKNNFERLRKIKRTRTASKIKFRFTRPKKKIEFTKGKVLESFESLSARLVSPNMVSNINTMPTCSRRRLRSSSFAKGCISLVFGTVHSPYTKLWFFTSWHSPLTPTITVAGYKREALARRRIIRRKYNLVFYCRIGWKDCPPFVLAHTP